MTQATENWMDHLMPFDPNRAMIPLESELIEACQERSVSHQHQSRQWHYYLQTLALESFTTWIQEREPSLVIQKDESSVAQPALVNVIDVVCGLKVGEFKVCLIPTISASDYEVAVPRAVVDLPEYAAHFYVVIALDEEAEIAMIQGFLRHDQLIDHCSEIKPDIDWNYPLAISDWNCDANELLLDLQCLDPIAIPLPSPTLAHSFIPAKLKADLTVALIQTTDQPLWNLLTWAQATVVLTNPELLDWLYHYQSHPAPSQSRALSALLQGLTQQVTNLWFWVQNQVDTWSGWEPIPASSLTRDLDTRSPAAKLNSILQEIRKTPKSPLEIPETAGRAYQDLQLDHHRLRLYAMSWSLTEQTWEWLLIVGAIPGDYPPDRLRLQVSDQSGVLTEKELRCDRQQAYLFVQAEGTYNETFLVTLTSATGTTHSLPAMTFCPES